MSLWQQAFDPHELREYVIDWNAPLVAAGDAIAAATVSLSAEATAAALRVISSAIDATGRKVSFRIDSSAPATTAAASGQAVEIVCAVTTEAGLIWRFGAMLRIEEITP